MGAVKELFEGMSRFGNTIAIGGLTTAAAGTLLVIRLERTWDVEELALMGCGGLVVAVGVGYVVIRGGRALARELRRHGFNVQSLVSWLRSRPQAEPDTPLDWLQTVTSTYGPGRRKLALPIGFTPRGAIAEIPMEGSESHPLFSGITGTGKSVLVNQVVIAAAMSGLYQVVIAAMTGKDYQIVSEMKNVHLVSYAEGVADPKEALAKFATELPKVVDSVNSEVTRRSRLMSEYEVRQLSDIRADVRPRSVLFLIEEFTNGIEQIKATQGARVAMEFLGQVMIAVQYARSANVHIGLIGQRPTAQIPQNIRQQMVKVSMRVANEQEAYWATGVKNSGADTLQVVEPRAGIPGEAVVVGALSGCQRVIVPLTPDDVLRQAAQFHEAETPFCGEPTWLYGYRPKPQTRPQTSLVRLENRVNLPVTNLVTTRPKANIVTTLSPVTNGTNGHSHHETNGFLSPVTKPAVTSRRPFILTPQLVAHWAGALYDKQPTFQDIPDEFTRDRCIAVSLCLFAGMSQNATLRAVFNGKNDRFVGYVKLVQSHMDTLNRAVAQRNGL